MKLLIVGTINNFCLETSYANAAEGLGHEVLRFDPRSVTKKYIKFKKFGEKLHDFVPVEAWTRKMNRELIVLAKDTAPDFILLFGNAKILFGTLVTIRLILPSAKIIWVWPDTPMNLESHNLDNAKLFDLSATYSSSTMESYSLLGFNNTQWVPLAGDNFMHYNKVPSADEFACDLSFVGMWRPERERIMTAINNNFPELNIELHGNYWQRNCSDKHLMKRWKGAGFYAKELSGFFNKSRININIIDDTNYPAANMRFFEIPVSGGLQLVSPCPEMEVHFEDKKNILFFKDEKDIIEKIRWILGNAAKAQEIRQAAHDLVTTQHTYTNRLTAILNYFKV
jgi:glycosyl transferase family 1